MGFKREFFTYETLAEFKKQSSTNDCFLFVKTLVSGF